MSKHTVGKVWLDERVDKAQQKKFIDRIAHIISVVVMKSCIKHKRVTKVHPYQNNIRM